VSDTTGGGGVRPRRLGLLGGTFDPPHVAHLAVAERAREELSLDRVLLVVANDPWQKSPLRRITPAADRLAMVQAAVGANAGLEASSLEIDRGGPSFTIDTVEELRAGGPVDLFLLVGADLVPTLPTWERVGDLAHLVTLVVVGRPGSPATLPDGWRAVGLEGPGIDVSSSEVRRRLESGGSVTGLVPDAVVHCIRRRGLYAVGR
jgi:nicotinate-nucleotide adenylyltransferase